MESITIRIPPADLDTTMNSDAFLSLSEQLTEYIAEHREIRARTLHEFTKLTILTIYKGEESVYSDVFQKLTDTLEHAWEFEMPDDTESRRERSYARLYQIIDTISIYHLQIQRERELLQAVEECRKYEDWLAAIYNNPGIRHGELSEKLGISASSLSQKPPEVELKGYVTATRLGRDKFYTLTSFGIRLYKRLRGKRDVEAMDKSLPTNLGNEIIRIVLDYDNNAHTRSIRTNMGIPVLSSFNTARQNSFTWNEYRKPLAVPPSDSGFEELTIPRPSKNYAGKNPKSIPNAALA